MHESEPIAESARVLRPPVDALEPEEPESPRFPPVREGLPPGFRMRADAHYVDQLDTRMSSIPVRLIDAQSIDPAHPHADTPSPAFVDSVKRLGVLQPLLVTVQGTRYRVIAGRRRLAAALAAGLRDVPCLVQHVDAEHAEQMALASNLPAARPRAQVPQPSSATDKPGAAAELTNIVAALVSCAELLSSPSTLTQTAAADLVRAEAARALDTLVAIRVLRDEMPISRAPVAIHTLIERLASTAALERQIRGLTLHIEASSDVRMTMVKADARLLVTALSGLVSAAGSLIESTGGSRLQAEGRPATAVRVRCSQTDAQVTLTVSQTSVELPGAWLARPFEIAWPVRNGGAALNQLQAARKIAQAHAGTLDVETIDGGTAFALTVPVAAAGA